MLWLYLEIFCICQTCPLPLIWALFWALQEGGWYLARKKPKSSLYNNWCVYKQKIALSFEILQWLLVSLEGQCKKIIWKKSFQTLTE